MPSGRLAQTVKASGATTPMVGIRFPVLLAWSNLSTVVWMVPFGWVRKIRIKFGGLVRSHPKIRGWALALIAGGKFDLSATSVFSTR